MHRDRGAAQVCGPTAQSHGKELASSRKGNSLNTRHGEPPAGRGKTAQLGSNHEGHRQGRAGSSRQDIACSVPLLARRFLSISHEAICTPWSREDLVWLSCFHPASEHTVRGVRERDMLTYLLRDHYFP